jgi:hypothetical protein
MPRIFRKILLVPQNNVIDLNIVMRSDLCWEVVSYWHDTLRPGGI